MRRALATLVFALAVGGATLAGSGLAVAPHVDPAGTPRYHVHALAAYRLPIFLMYLQRGIVRGPGFELTTPESTGLAGLILALLVVATPRLPRPTRRPFASVRLAPLASPQWRGSPILGPPRAPFCPSVA